MVVFEDKGTFDIRFGIVCRLFDFSDRFCEIRHVGIHFGNIVVMPDEIDRTIFVFKKASIDIGEQGFGFIPFDIYVGPFWTAGCAFEDKGAFPRFRVVHAGNDKPVLLTFYIVELGSPYGKKSIVQGVAVERAFLVLLVLPEYFAVFLLF